MTPEKVIHLIAGIIANLLRKASKSGKWDLFRSIIQKVEKVCHLFNEVYDDETLSKEDEEKIAEAIEELTEKESIKGILNKVDVMM
jgi:superfamily I DNA and RNA helicase